MKELLVKLLEHIEGKLEIWPESEIFLCIAVHELNTFVLKDDKKEQQLLDYLKKNKPSPTLHKEHYVEPNEKFYGRDMWWEYGQNEDRIEFLKYLIELQK